MHARVDPGTDEATGSWVGSDVPSVQPPSWHPLDLSQPFGGGGRPSDPSNPRVLLVEPHLHAHRGGRGAQLDDVLDTGLGV